MTTKKPTRPSVKLVDGHATTTSTAVAQFFGRRHKDVLRAIENLKADCPAEYHERNFAPMVVEVDIGSGATRKDPAYQLTRDGFTLLAMGFTGKAALAWKIKYIEAFNKLEDRAKARAVVLATRKLKANHAAERRRELAAPASDELADLALSRLRAGKFVMYFDENGDMCLFSRSRKAIFADPVDLATIIADPKGSVGREHLPAIISAAARRLT